jgi:hypothetical protein
MEQWELTYGCHPIHSLTSAPNLIQPLSMLFIAVNTILFYMCSLNSFKSLQFPVAQLRRLELPMSYTPAGVALHPAFLTPRGNIDVD